MELDGSQIFNLQEMQQSRPTIGLLISQEADDLQPQSLLAQVESIEELANSQYSKPQETILGAQPIPVAIELSFPESLKRQQQSKVKRLLKTLK